MSGAIELPPESEFSEPIRDSSEPSPSAPRTIDSVHRVVRVVAGVVFRTRRNHRAVDERRSGRRDTRTACMPRRNALSRVERETRGRRCDESHWSPVLWIGYGRHHVAGQALACCSPPCSGSPTGRRAWPTSTLEPAMLAPPARSKQMNGILPAPWVTMPQLFTQRGISEVARQGRQCCPRIRRTVTEHAAAQQGRGRCRSMKPCAMNSRRVRVRGRRGGPAG